MVKALNVIAPEVISWPRGDHLLNTKATFQKMSNLPNVIGAIDGTHIEIPAPEVCSYIVPILHQRMILIDDPNDIDT